MGFYLNKNLYFKDKLFINLSVFYSSEVMFPNNKDICHRDDFIIFVQKCEKDHNCTDVLQRNSNNTNKLVQHNENDLVISSFVYLSIIFNILVWNLLSHSYALFICWFIYLYVLFVLYRVYLIKN